MVGVASITNCKLAETVAHFGAVAMNQMATTLTYRRRVAAKLKMRRLKEVFAE